MRDLHCLRCKTVVLADAAPPDPRIAFFECPNCGRHYALQPDRQLTFRWLHPISLALYPVLFDESPSGRAIEVAALLIKGQTKMELEVFTREIRLELAEPTQQVRDILDCRAPEKELRAFLASVVGEIEAFLARERNR